MLPGTRAELQAARQQAATASSDAENHDNEPLSAFFMASFRRPTIQVLRPPRTRSGSPVVCDTGTRYYILEVIAYAAVVTNAALVAFTGTWAIDYTYTARIWIFLAMTAGLMYVKYLVAEWVPDTPREVEIQLERQEYYIGKLIDNIPDEDDMGLVENINAEIKYTIRVNDDDPL